jgi:predicted transcriptional regulator of viral defense system
MIQTYKELEALYGSGYQIKKAISEGKIFKIAKGLYSYEQSVHPLEIIVKKYPQAIFTMDSAFFFHGMTDVIPRKMFLSVKRDSTKITNNDIVQIFVLEKYHKIGKTQTTFEGVLINVYDKERMLIELVRNKKGMPFDYYKEIINSYRRKLSQLDVRNLEDYSNEFGLEDYIFRTIQEEVF